MLIPDRYFTINLTKKSYNTRSYDDLTCKSTSVVFGLECNLCGLVYVGQTKGGLSTRMCGHRSRIKNSLFPEDYHHCMQPNHSNLSMKNCILGKIYYHPSIMTKLIVYVTYLVQDASVMNIFNNSPRRKRRHCHRQYASPKLHDVSINGLLSYVQLLLGMNNVRTKLHSLLLSKFHSLYATCLKT